MPFLDVQRETGFARSLDDAAMYSANWQAWLTSAAWAHRWLLPWLENSSEVLFPGVLTLLVGGAGPGAGIAWAGSRHRRRVARETARFYALVRRAGAVGVLRSLRRPLHRSSSTRFPSSPSCRAPASFGILVVDRARRRHRASRWPGPPRAGPAARGPPARRSRSRWSPNSRRCRCPLPERRRRTTCTACWRRCGPAPSSRCRSSTAARTSRATPSTCSTRRITGSRWSTATATTSRRISGTW